MDALTDWRLHAVAACGAVYVIADGRISVIAIHTLHRTRRQCGCGVPVCSLGSVECWMRDVVASAWFGS